jgi:serine/threonine-protein kinase RsbW
MKMRSKRLEVFNHLGAMGRLILPGRYENLVKIAEFVKQAAAEAGLGSEAVYQVETAVDEACTNIIEHAYGGENLGDIDCTTCVTQFGLTVILRDTGKPFIPQKIRRPNPKTPLAKRHAHGLGLYLITEWMDDVHFDADPASGKTITMTKRKALTP